MHSMNKRKNILAINGSASKNSSNLSIINFIKASTEDKFHFTTLRDLSNLPHFNTELTNENTPEVIINVRDQISAADGIIICTPEYVFSIPSGLKNLIEWCVSTTIFSNKPVGLITASASGIKGHEELKLIMKTIEAKFSIDTTLLIQGIKGKIDKNGIITSSKTKKEIASFVESLINLISKIA